MWSWEDWLAFPYSASAWNSGIQQNDVLSNILQAADRTWSLKLPEAFPQQVPGRIFLEPYTSPCNSKWMLGNKGYWLNYFLGTVLVTLLNFNFLQNEKKKGRARERILAIFIPKMYQ